MGRQVRLRILVAAALAAMVFAIYWQTRQFEFTIWDDQDYVTENVHVRTGISTQNFKWAFTAFEAANWHPLTWLSHMLDAQLFGLNPKGHHLTSVALHLLNSILLFLLLERMTGFLWRSALVAALFAVHPLHVESVAWVAERKDVLSTMFWLLTMWAYVRYTEKENGLRYGLVMLLLALGLLAKPMLVTLPFVLLLCDFWPLSRLFVKAKGRSREIRWSVLVEKGPLLIVAALSSVVTLLAQAKGGAVHPLENISYLSRLVNALISYVTYLGKMIWPAKLACFYPYRLDTLSAAAPLGALLLLASVSYLAFRSRAKYPYFMVGWLWYLGTLVPVIGLVQVGSQAMADRYTYIPLIGIYLSVIWLASEFTDAAAPVGWSAERKRRSGIRRRSLVVAFTVVLLCALIARSHYQAACWKNTRALFEHALGVTKDNFTALHMLGTIDAKEDRVDEAINKLESAIRISDSFAATFNILGTQYAKKGRWEDAIRAFQRTVAIEPKSPWYVNLGNAYLQQGRIEDAIKEYRICSEVVPNYPECHRKLGSIYLERGNLEEALNSFRRAVEHEPKDPLLHGNLGLIYDKQNRLQEAVQEFRLVLELKPNDFDAHNNLGYVYGKLGRLDEAVRELEAAIRIMPEHPEPHNNLGEVYRRQGRLDMAREELQLALKKDPAHLEARTSLGKVYRDQLKYADAIREFRQVLKINPTYEEAQECLRASLEKPGRGR